MKLFPSKLIINSFKEGYKEKKTFFTVFVFCPDFSCD